MENKGIHVVQIQVQELIEFARIYLQDAQAGAFIPITKHRAEALANNPLAEPEDTAFLAAYDGKKLIGYFGMMPVVLFYADEVSKAYWFTTWRVNKMYMGRGVGSILMQAALDVGHDYIIVGSAAARKVCTKFGFSELPHYYFTVIKPSPVWKYNPAVIGLRTFRKLFTMAGGRINIKKASDASGQFFSKLFDPFIKPMFYDILLGAAKKGLEPFELKRVKEVRPHDTQRVADLFTSYLVRDTAVINWMLEYPWVLPAGDSESEEMDYFFTDTRPEFKIFAQEISVQWEYKGFVIYQFAVKYGLRTLRVLDHFVFEPEDEPYLLAAVLQTAKAFGADEIQMASDLTTKLQGGLIGKMVLARRKRIYQVHPQSEHSPLGNAWRHLQFNIADGDVPFT